MVLNLASRRRPPLHGRCCMCKAPSSSRCCSQCTSAACLFWCDKVWNPGRGMPEGSRTRESTVGVVFICVRVREMWVLAVASSGNCWGVSLQLGNYFFCFVSWALLSVPYLLVLFRCILHTFLVPLPIYSREKIRRKPLWSDDSSTIYIFPWFFLGDFSILCGIVVGWSSILWPISSLRFCFG
jgi:hypothetical protein